jgi:hypothetical protein
MNSHTTPNNSGDGDSANGAGATINLDTLTVHQLTALLTTHSTRSTHIEHPWRQHTRHIVRGAVAVAALIAIVTWAATRNTTTTATAAVTAAAAAALIITRARRRHWEEEQRHNQDHAHIIRLALAELSGSCRHWTTDPARRLPQLTVVLQHLEQHHRNPPQPAYHHDTVSAINSLHHTADHTATVHRVYYDATEYTGLHVPAAVGADNLLAIARHRQLALRHPLIDTLTTTDRNNRRHADGRLVHITGVDDNLYITLHTTIGPQLQHLERHHPDMLELASRLADDDTNHHHTWEHLIGVATALTTDDHPHNDSDQQTTAQPFPPTPLHQQSPP